MAKITACIISFNEEAKIERCLKSLVAVVDEIVVVDSLSSDRTVEIVRRYTHKVFDQPFLGYIEQKNLAVSKASHEWILSIDCDEVLSDELQASILAIKGDLQQHDAYRMARRTFYVYRWLNHCWYPDQKVRLYNRTTARWGGAAVHERLLVEGSDIQQLQGDIHHYSFDSISEHIQTLDRFTDIGAQEIIAKGKRVSLFAPISHGLWTFIRLYLIKRGFLDGLAGLVVAVLSFMHAFVKYSKVLMIQRQQALQGGGSHE